MTFGENLKRLYKARNFTQDTLSTATEELGNKIHIHTISKYVNGETFPNLRNARTLAAALDVSLDFLFNDYDIYEFPEDCDNDDITHIPMDEEVYTQLRNLLSKQGEEKLRLAELYMDYLLATQEAPCKEK